MTTILRADVHDEFQKVLTIWRDTAKGIGETEEALVYRDALNMLTPALADTDDDALAFLNDLAWRFEDDHSRNFMDPSADAAWERVKRRHAMLTSAVLREQTSPQGVCQSLIDTFKHHGNASRVEDARLIWAAAARHLTSCRDLHPLSAEEMLSEMTEWVWFMKSRYESVTPARVEALDEVLSVVVTAADDEPVDD